MQPYLLSRRSLFLGTVFCVVVGASTVVAQQDEPVESTIRVNGLEMYVRIYGKGEPIVLLHGFGQSNSQWRGVIPELSATHRVIVPDLRGHGRSTNPAHSFTHRQAALDVFALLDSLHVDHFRAMGSSSGGMTLLHMAIGQPRRIDAMVLMSATTQFPDQARKLMAASTVESMTPEMWTQRRRIHHYGDDQIRELQNEFRAFKDSYDDMNLTAVDLAKITARTLIIHGDRDQFFPIEIAVDMYKAIHGSELFIVPGGAHGLVLSSPIPVFPAAIAFLNRANVVRQPNER